MATARSVSNLSVVLSADTTGATKGFHDVSKGVDALGKKVQSKNIFNPLDAAAGTFFKGFSAKNMQLGGQLHNLHLQATTLPKKTAAAINQATQASGGGGSGGSGGGGGAMAGGLIGGLFGGAVGGAVGSAAGTLFDSTIGAVTGSLTSGVRLISSAVKEIISVGAEYEMAMAVFAAAAGSEEKGKSILKGLSNLAAGTTFSTQALAQQARILQGYGVAADNLVPTLTKLALITQKSGRGEVALEGGVLAFAQSRAMGKLQGNERRQFTEAGISVEEFAKTVGVTTAQFEDMMMAGQIGFDVVAKTINRMGSESATVADKMNQTLIGRFNSVKDLALQAFGEIGVGIIKAFQLPETLAGVAGFLREMPEKAKELYPYLEKSRDLLAPIVTGLYGGLKAAWEAGKNLATGLMPSMQTASQHAQDFGKFLAVGIGKAIDMVLSLGNVLTVALRPLAMLLDKALPYISDVKFPSFMDGLNTASGAIVEAQQKAGRRGYGGIAADAFKAGIPKLPEFATKYDQSGTTVGAASLPKAITELAKSINESSMMGGGSKTAYGEFATNFANLQNAEAAGLITSKAGADSFLFAEFKKLSGSMGRIENTLPAAIDRFTVEGQGRIDKVIANMQSRGADDVPDILRRAHETAREQLKIQKETVDAIRKSGVVPLVVGG